MEEPMAIRNRQSIDETAYMAEDTSVTGPNGGESQTAADGRKQEAMRLEPARRRLAAAGTSDLTRAADAELVAERIARLSEVVASAGAQDLAQGVELLAEAEDVDTLSALVGVMSLADLERAMQLARLSGELQMAGALVGRLHMPILAMHLTDRSALLGDIAIDSVLQSSAT